MVWTPTTKVFIDGIEYTDDTLADVAITYGKKDITEAFRASFARVSLLSDGSSIPFDLNDNCVIKIADSTNTDVTIFTGRVLDISVDMLSPSLVKINVNMLSPVARLGRRFVGADGYAHEFDGTRINSILTEAGNVIWLEAGGTWASQDPTSTWNVYEAIGGTIDTGNFELHAYSLGGGFVTDLITVAERSGLGHLYEGTDGHVNYQDSDARLADATANGYEPIDGQDVILSGTNAQISTAFTTNSVEVQTYTGHIESDSDYTSVAEYGRIYEKIDTWLRHNADAVTYAGVYLGRYANPKPVLSSFTIPLSQVSTAQRDILINMRGGLPVSIDDLPAAMAPNPYEGFVEGWQWKITTGEAFITLNISDKALSI